MPLPFEVFFDSYVHNFICRDISREIAAGERAKREGGDGGANFLTALGLLTHTEVLGDQAAVATP